GRPNRIVYLEGSWHCASDQGPIDSPPMARCAGENCGHSQTCKGILKASVLKKSFSPGGSDVKIEVTRQNDYDIETISTSIVQQFGKLAEAEFIAVAALEMKVIHDQTAAADRQIGYQRHAPTDPSLKSGQRRNPPMRMPEF